MPEYLVLDNANAAARRSNEIALELGCGPITQYWFGWRIHPSDGRAALIVLDESENENIAERGRPELTGTELANLKKPLSKDWEPEEDETV